MSLFIERSGFEVAESVQNFNDLLDGLRMPTLVGLSGILAAGVVKWTWSDVWRRRVAPLLLLYYVWTIVFLVVGMPLRYGRGAIDSLDRAWQALLRPEPYVWYLLALACFIAAARLLRRVPTLVLISAAIGAYLMFRLWVPRPPVTGPGGWLRLANYWIFFVVGERASHLWMRWGDRAEWKRAVLATAAFVVIGGTLVFVLGMRVHPVMSLVLCLLGMICSVAVAGATAHLPFMRWARAIGRRSLGVYAVHAWLGYAVWVRLGEYVPEFPGSSVVVPVGYSAGVVAAAYGVTAALARWAPVPFVRPWWSMARRDTDPAQRPARAGAE